MKKKVRIRKRPLTEGRPDGAEEESAVTEVVESKPEESSAAPALSHNGKIEVVAGFAIMGVSVGFLSGYGNFDLMAGISQGLLGLAAGAALGYLPYLNLKGNQ